MFQIEIKHLELIQSIAKTENLTRAARRLNISQPALSRRLLDIEERLGTRLFFRSKKRMMLTLEGTRMLQSADTILRELELTELEISKIVNGETGTLRLGVSCIFCFQWLPAVVADFQQHYPKVDIAVSTCQDLLEELNARAFDMVLTATPVEQKKIDCVKLFEDELVVIMAPDHPLRARRFLLPEDISNNKIITNTDMALEHFSRLLWPDTPINPQAVMQISQLNAIIELVKAGIGISMAPRWAVRSYLTSGDLSAIPLSEHGIHPTWKVAFLKNQKLAVFQEKFIDLMKNYFPLTINRKM